MGTPVASSAAVTPLEIPEAGTPQASGDSQQVSPLLMSIKKLVRHQDTLESGGGLMSTPSADTGVSSCRLIVAV